MSATLTEPSETSPETLGAAASRIAEQAKQEKRQKFLELLHRGSAPENIAAAGLDCGMTPQQIAEAGQIVAQARELNRRADAHEVANKANTEAEKLIADFDAVTDEILKKRREMREPLEARSSVTRQELLNTVSAGSDLLRLLKERRDILESLPLSPAWIRRRSLADREAAAHQQRLADQQSRREQAGRIGAKSAIEILRAQVEHRQPATVADDAADEVGGE